MSKFKEFIKKVASKCSTPVKPLASEVFEEESDVYNKKNLVELVEKMNLKLDDKLFNEAIIKTQNAIKEFEASMDRVKNVYQENELKNEVDKLKTIQVKTKNKRIKKKLQKRIDTYGKNTITRN